jgi:hypothetical protein
LLEQQSKRRSRMKLAVFCVLAVNVVGLMAMLIQGCKREQTEADNPPPADTNTSAMDTNTPPAVEAVQSTSGNQCAAGGDAAAQPLKPPGRNTSSSRATRLENRQENGVTSQGA